MDLYDHYSTKYPLTWQASTYLTHVLPLVRGLLYIINLVNSYIHIHYTIPQNPEVTIIFKQISQYFQSNKSVVLKVLDGSDKQLRNNGVSLKSNKNLKTCTGLNSYSRIIDFRVIAKFRKCFQNTETLTNY